MKLEVSVLEMMAEPVPVPFSLVWKICSQRRAMLYDSPGLRHGVREVESGVDWLVAEER